MSNISNIAMCPKCGNMEEYFEVRWPKSIAHAALPGIKSRPAKIVRHFNCGYKSEQLLADND